MTTPTSTGEIPGGVTLAAPSGGALPDVATLARWANELFAAVPGAPPLPPTNAPLPGAPLPGAGAPTAAAPSAPAIPAADSYPANAASGYPFFAALVNAELPRLGAHDLSHPELPAVPLPGPPALPGHPGHPGALATSAPVIGGAPSFYFLQDPGVPALPRGHGHPAFDVHSIRRDFPILSTRVHGRPLVWFDNAATTQKPTAVIDRLSYFYRNENSNIHRAAHELAARATDAYENARRQVQRFLGAASADEIVFVRGATEAINLVAQSWGRRTSRRVMKSSCRISSITPTSCRGRCWRSSATLI